jgi:hypothetical protein
MKGALPVSILHMGGKSHLQTKPVLCIKQPERRTRAGQQGRLLRGREVPHFVNVQNRYCGQFRSLKSLKRQVC